MVVLCNIPRNFSVYFNSFLQDNELALREPNISILSITLLGSLFERDLVNLITSSRRIVLRIFIKHETEIDDGFPSLWQRRNPCQRLWWNVGKTIMLRL